MQIDQYAVIGNPIQFSKSPIIHSTFALATNQSLHYDKIQAPIDGFVTVAQQFRAKGGLGLNVTAPFKLDAFAWCNEHSDQARLAGAVNAIKFEGEKIVGENFDGLGLVKDTLFNLKQTIASRRVLLLGAGGATRGALLPLISQKPSLLMIANRDVGKAQSLITQFQTLATDLQVELVACSYAQLAQQGPFDLVYNATSASLFAEAPAPDVPINAFNPNGMAYDLAYGKGLTPFLQKARSAGVTQLADGVGMLVEQAALAFAWWRSVQPETKPVIELIRVRLD